jgi:hypothetical protein
MDDDEARPRGAQGREQGALFTAPRKVEGHAFNIRSISVIVIML